jgi:hypothetical protein
MTAHQMWMLSVRLEAQTIVPIYTYYIIKFPYALRICDNLNLQLTNDINLVHILEPYCSNAIPEPNEDVDSVRRYLSEKSSPSLWCRVNPSTLSLKQIVYHFI